MAAHIYDCFEGKRYVCTGTLVEIAEQTGKAINTVKSYASGVGGHKYQIYKRPRRQRDLDDMRRYGVAEIWFE